MQVKVRNPAYGTDVMLFEQPQFFVFVGEETQLKHCDSSVLCLTTGIAEWPVRVIPRVWIESVDGAAVEFAPASPTQKLVKGSRGEVYTVTLGPRPTCTCAGFSFRKTCRHIKEAV